MKPSNVLALCQEWSPRGFAPLPTGTEPARRSRAPPVVRLLPHCLLGLAVSLSARLRSLAPMHLHRTAGQSGHKTAPGPFSRLPPTRARFCSHPFGSAAPSQVGGATCRAGVSPLVRYCRPIRCARLPLAALCAGMEGVRGARLLARSLSGVCQSVSVWPQWAEPTWVLLTPPLCVRARPSAGLALLSDQAAPGPRRVWVSPCQPCAGSGRSCRSRGAREEGGPFRRPPTVAPRQPMYLVARCCATLSCKPMQHGTLRDRGFGVSGLGR